ncbi:MAG: MarR family transcriptional regulator [Elusimicrobia bacterium]|nr:MarR family transcriptional regulator [Elusimicrobiota bacterium]
MNKTPCETRACELVDYLQTVMGEMKGTDKKNQTVCQILSTQEIQVLLALGRRGPLIMSDIAEGIQLSLSSVTGIVDKLEEKRVVQRERSGEDRRIVQAELTEEGRRLHKLALEGHIRMAQSMLQALDAKEQETLVALFKKVAKAIAEAKQAAA